jgi:hypothetical protein
MTPALAYCMSCKRSVLADHALATDVHANARAKENVQTNRKNSPRTSDACSFCMKRGGRRGDGSRVSAAACSATARVCQVLGGTVTNSLQFDLAADEKMCEE